MIQKSNPSSKFFSKKIIAIKFHQMALQNKKLFYFCIRLWRDGRVVERGGLENR